jgi:hypothetical protein
LVRSGAVHRRLLALESAILARRETAMPWQFDQVLLANPIEAARLAQLTGAGQRVRNKTTAASGATERRQSTKEMFHRRTDIPLSW